MAEEEVWRCKTIEKGLEAEAAAEGDLVRIKLMHLADCCKHNLEHYTFFCRYNLNFC